MALNNILTLDDARLAIKDLDQRLAYFESRNIDFNQRRVINAHPSVDDYDYVVRKELRDLIGGAASIQPRLIGSSSGGFYLRTFGFSIGSNLSTGTDLLPPLIIPFPSTTLVKVYAKCKIAPTGADAIADIKLLGVSIFDSNKITIPAGSTAVKVISTFTTSAFSEPQVLTFDVTQIGSTIPGQTLVVTMKFKVA